MQHLQPRATEELESGSKQGTGGCEARGEVTGGRSLISAQPQRKHEAVSTGKEIVSNSLPKYY